MYRGLTRGLQLVSRKRGRALAVLASTFLIWGALGAPADAGTTTKPYGAAATASMFAGGTYDGSIPQYGFVTYTITNNASPQDIGSANIVVPAGITVTVTLGTSLAAPVETNNLGETPQPSAIYENGVTYQGKKKITGPVVALRDLNLPPLASVTVSIPATMECSPAHAPYNWYSEVKQSNDFSGVPGNDFVVSGGIFPPTAQAGDCSLAWVTQPNDAGAGDLVTNTAFDPSGPPVSVTLLDGSGTLPVTWWTNPVTIDRADFNPTYAGPASKTPLSTGTQGPAGTWTFAPTVAAAGYGYHFHATTMLEDGSSTWADSGSFNIQYSVGDCSTPGNCKASEPSNGKTAASLDTVASLNNQELSAYAFLSINPGNTSQTTLCNYTPVAGDGSSDLVYFGVTTTNSAGNQKVTITLSKSYVTKSASKYNLCYRKVGGTFPVKSGTLPWYTYTDGSSNQGDANGAPTGTVAFEDGVLPQCVNGVTVNTVTNPCYLSISKVSGGGPTNGAMQAVVLIQAGDPPMRLY